MFEVFTEEIEILIKDGVANLYWYRGDLNKAWHRVGVPAAMCNEIYQLKDETGGPLSKRRQMDKLYEYLRGADFSLRLRISRGFVRTLIEHKNFVPQDEKHRIVIAERAALKLRELIAAQESEKEEKERTKREAAAARVPTYHEQLSHVRDSFAQARKMEPRPRGYALEKVALRENLTDPRFMRRFCSATVFGYTREFERQRLDEDPGLAGLQGLQVRDPRTRQDLEALGAA